MTDLVPVSAGALDAHDDPVGVVLAFLGQAAVAVRETSDLDEARHILAAISTLEHATRARDLNAEMVAAAGAMRVRAERRIGQLLAERGKNKGGRPRLRAVPETPSADRGVSDAPPPTLADHGISYDQAAAYGKLAEADEETFDAAVEGAERDAIEGRSNTVSRANVLRKVDPPAPPSTAGQWAEADRWVVAARKLARTSEQPIAAMRFGIYPGGHANLPANQAPRVAESVLVDIDQAIAALTEARTVLTEGTR